jgi:hypothetical protein
MEILFFIILALSLFTTFCIGRMFGHMEANEHFIKLIFNERITKLQTRT